MKTTATMKNWYAHSAGVDGAWQTMSAHTEAVSTGAKARLPEFLAEDGYLAGLVHDFGKFSVLFRERLAGRESGFDHWTPGAYLLLRAGLSQVAALVVHGHHVGLAPWGAVCTLKDQYRSLEGRKLTLEETDITNAVREMKAEMGLDLSGASKTDVSPSVAGMLDTRFVLSAVVDTDHSDTAKHFTGHCRSTGRQIDADAALAALERAIHGKSKGEMSRGVRAMRELLRASASEAALLPRGLFTLEAPTGSGKTMAMLEFALRHLKEHGGKDGLRRIIVVLPYLSLLDQTVSEIRAALGNEAADLFEHHSIASWRNSDGVENALGRERAEDWDAPIVVTTSVQFLQTLFANKTVPLRKLHSVGRSIILLDEIQSIPRPLALATMRALARLASPEYGGTVVLSTATQPAWEPHAIRFSGKESPFSPVTIAPRSLGLFDQVRRFQVDWTRVRQATNWDALARELIEEGRVLIIVNLKAHARQLAQAVRRAGWKGPLLHLSTNLCPEHRKRVLDDPSIGSGDCILVATQCVEAGVDLDFPVVYRALAPLEAIVQAAGRCNRHGKGLGKVRVFLPEFQPGEVKYPGSAYATAADVTAKMLDEFGDLDLHRPAIFDTYYRRLDVLCDEPLTTRKMEDAIDVADFPRVAELYKLIEERDVVNVLVPYPGAPEVPQHLDERWFRGLRAEWFRSAQRYSVSAHRGAVEASVWARWITEDRRWWQVTEADAYDVDLLGLVLDKELSVL